MEYRELLQEMLNQYSEMIGEVAYTQAEKIEDLKLEDRQIRGDPSSKQVREMVDSFSQIIGDGSKAVARKAVKEAYKNDKSVKNLEMPDEIKPKDMKADQFASAL